MPSTNPDFQLNYQTAIKSGLLPVGKSYHPIPDTLMEALPTKEIGTQRWAPKWAVVIARQLSISCADRRATIEAKMAEAIVGPQVVPTVVVLATPAPAEVPPLLRTFTKMANLLPLLEGGDRDAATDFMEWLEWQHILALCQAGDTDAIAAIAYQHLEMTPG